MNTLKGHVVKQARANSQPYDIKPLIKLCRYLTGWGDEHGTMVLIVRSLQPHLNETKASGVKESVGSVQVCLFQMVPWFLHLWLHTLQVAIDGQVSF